MGPHYKLMYFPINEFLLKEEKYSFRSQVAWYQAILDELVDGRSVLVVCKNGMHRS